MLQKSRFLLLSIVILLAFLPACSAKTEGVVPTAVPSITVQPPTAIPPTNTLLPPTATIEPSATSTQPPTEAPPTLHCEGEGSPALILNIGYGMVANAWNTNNFFRDLSRITQTCYYQREKSITAKPNTLVDIVDDLHSRITNSQIIPPYVVLGHSAGGWIAIRYAYAYPEEVAGVVLMDSPHPNYPLRALEIIPTASPDEPVSLTNYRDEFINWYTFSPGYEAWDFITNAEQVREVTSLGDIPILVLSADGQLIGSGIPEINQRLTDDWIAQHKEMAALSTQGRQVTVENTGHIMWWDNPSRIISLFRSFIQQVRSASP